MGPENRVNRARCFAHVLACSAVCWGLSPSKGAAADPPAKTPVADASRASFLLSGMKTNFERLRLGIFRAHGAKTRIRDNGAQDKVRFEVFCAFDFDNDLLRFDRREEDWVARGVMPEDDQFIRYARTPKQAITWYPPTQLVLLSPPDEKPGIMKVLHPFDVRAVGYITPGLFSRRPTFEEAWKMIEGHGTPEVAAEGGRHRLVWYLGNPPNHRETLWLDEGHGFAPVRYEVTGRANVSKPWAPTTLFTETAWERASDVSVPVKVLMQDRRGDIRETFEMSFTWDSVNQPIPPEVLSIEGMSIPYKTPIADARLGGKPIIVGHFGDPPPVSAEALRKAAWPLRRVTLVVVGVLVFVCLAIFVLRGRRKRGNRPENEAR